MERFTTVEMSRFNYLMGETDAVYHEASLKLGLSDSVSKILYTVCDLGDGCQLSDICRLCGTSKQTINSALRRLEAEGTIYLESVDGKKKKVCLTDSGKKLASATVVRLIEIENSILDSWSKEEVEQYLRLTGKYLKQFKEKIREL